ncbi:MerR family transcriptional regulator [Dictyobacter aurantiacus]|uniref:Redox-sensitive transcriptional activator SoxR n=1 Tax=Dictyobacter aurantiacus TaxID=1936993 RepID=A0A401Z7W3_9CHLR|nr:MerR family transcriptional regulator [Dictyobacter aurantiacus]GCE02951.1 redox-sensitive transcriptional activator SoxR [Dictyobacter aurantiacus]
MEELTISQVAAKAGLRPSAIRYYESINVLPAPRRISGQRRYDPAVLDHLAFIQIAQKLGFSLTEIQFLFEQRGEETPLADYWQNVARQKLTEVDALIRQATHIKHMLIQGMRCNCPNLSDCINCVLTNCQSSTQQAGQLRLNVLHPNGHPEP